MPMLAAILVFTLRDQAVERPPLPIGASPVISKAVNHIAELTERADFEGAKAALKLLPSRVVKIEWDDSAAPKEVRYDFGRVRDQVFADWQARATAISYTVVPKDGDLKVVFSDEQGSNLDWSEAPSQSRLTLRIGLKERGKPVDPATVNNKLSYAIGSYVGVAKMPMAGYLMSDPELPAPAALRPNRLEGSIASGTVLACEKIRDAVLKSTVLKSGLPKIAQTPDPVDLGKVLQGDVMEMNFSVKNAGSSMLAFQVVPDCSCFSVSPMQISKPDQELFAKAHMNTGEFFGSIHKTLYLVSNDAEQPIRPIPVSVSVKPRYRMLPPMKTYIADDKPLTIEAFLYYPGDRPLHITSADSQGLPGDVKVQKWEGKMADPDLGEEALARKGYKVTLNLKNIPEGSQFGTNIVLNTDDPLFPTIYYPLFVQKGIVASPPNIYFGEIGAASRSVSIVVARPGQPFEITGVESDSVHLTPTFQPIMNGDQAKPGEYRVTVTYDGKGTAGDYRAYIKIKTNDPKQSTIAVPVTAIIRS